ncbi:hypothetical protein [Streptomyces sp. NBC_00893]|uniref:hypothetical protein n=1 Tax=Streptomyces sp. NBC_00893 TaxID=2975862 RepID=UPI002259EEF0|nr:hypothetical protein [Streptomyces sp. NBC_00893]MCX4846061.1 hypothetical protein [Streptomyces sp. NBC_00893]
MRARLAAVVGTVVLGSGMLVNAPAAHAADPVSDFDVTVGNTYTRGTITWHNRSVTVAGEQKSVSATNCRGTTAFTLDANNNQLDLAYTSPTCGASEKFIPFTVVADVPGGAAVVRVCLDDGSLPATYFACKRYGRPSS